MIGGRFFHPLNLAKAKMIRQGLTGMVLILALGAGPAMAGNNGLSYTSRGGSTPIQKSEGAQQMRSISYPTTAGEPAASAEGAAPATGEAAEDENATPASRVWKKYKNLASGTEEQTPEVPVEDVEKEVLPEGSEPPTEAPKPTGFAAILDQYQKNKDARSSMKTLTISKPEAPAAPEKPEVETPEKAPAEK
jgi:hypothetical protein